MYGLDGASAAATALLLNLEPILTVLLAWLVFGEAVGRRIAVGMLAIGAGALVLAWQGGSATGGAAAMLAVAAACLGWAIDNNLTRKIALSDPCGSPPSRDARRASSTSPPLCGAAPPCPRRRSRRPPALSASSATG